MIAWYPWGLAAPMGHSWVPAPVFICAWAPASAEVIREWKGNKHTRAPHEEIGCVVWHVKSGASKLGREHCIGVLGMGDEHLWRRKRIVGSVMGAAGILWARGARKGRLMSSRKRVLESCGHVRCHPDGCCACVLLYSATPSLSSSSTSSTAAFCEVAHSSVGWPKLQKL
ncbi:hypothetical protein BV22DRAFT_764660 [Leucogyrophana mollusca]|uniref:Uncharacterized protein n=1 Tax=Leucogyrophana mollusca TaxID=85980 RepID=A0ACB8B725_9AGAM|nr:hypothetical protein BV22DRAFT_764660 [Leucogyrophana mollusca]